MRHSLLQIWSYFHCVSQSCSDYFKVQIELLYHYVCLPHKATGLYLGAVGLSPEVAKWRPWEVQPHFLNYLHNHSKMKWQEILSARNDNKNEKVLGWVPRYQHPPLPVKKVIASMKSCVCYMVLILIDSVLLFSKYTAAGDATVTFCCCFELPYNLLTSPYFSALNITAEPDSPLLLIATSPVTPKWTYS